MEHTTDNATTYDANTRASEKLEEASLPAAADTSGTPGTANSFPSRQVRRQWRRKIGLTRILEFIHCHRRGHSSLITPRHLRDERNRRQLVGAATHMWLAGTSEDQIRKHVYDALLYPSQFALESILQESLLLFKRAPESSELDKEDTRRHFQGRAEQQFFWPFAGAIIAANPDRWRFTNEHGMRWPHNADRQYERKHSKILRVIDYKTRGTIVPSDWERAELMTLVTTEMLDWHGATKMVLYPLRQGLVDDGTEYAPVKPVERWWNPKLPGQPHRSRELADATRNRLHGAIVELERCWEQHEKHRADPESYPDDGFPPSPGGHCFACHKRLTCAAGQMFMQLRRAENEAAAGIKLPTRHEADELEQACFAYGSRIVSMPAKDLHEHVGHMVHVRLGNESVGQFRQLKDVLSADGLVKLVFARGVTRTAGLFDRYDVRVPAPGFLASAD